MSGDSPRRPSGGGGGGVCSRGGHAMPSVVPPQVVSDRSILDSAIGFINDVTLSHQPHTDSKDTITWARFESAADISDPRHGEDWELEGNVAPPLLLILGYGLGVQVWAIPANGEAVEVLSWRHGVVSALRVLPTPSSSSGQCGSYDENGRADEHCDAFAEKRPLIAMVDGTAGSTGAGQSQFSSVNFVSLRTGTQVKTIKFKNPVLDILANRSSIVITLHERIAVFDARTLEDRLSITTCYPSPGINPNPVALGPRWLAYAENKLLHSKRSGGGCDGDGVASYTATVLNAAKSFGKGLRELGEQVAAGLTGTTGSAASSKSSSFDSGSGPDGKQPGIVTIMDIKNPLKEYGGTPTGSSSSQSGCDPILAHFIAHLDAVVALEFDNSGMLLVTADRRGHDFHIFRIQPHPVGSSLAAVHHLYVLHRGDTTAKVQNIALSLDSRWVAVSTLRGTTHVFPITPYGGPMGVRTHTSLHVVNKLSRFHRSAGLSAEGRSSSPISHSESTTFMQSLQPYHNPTLPPYPRPTIVLPLAQLRQPMALGSPPGSAGLTGGTGVSGKIGVGSGGGGGGSQRQRLSSLSDDSGKPLSVCAIFAKSRSWLLEPPNATREAPHRIQRKAVDSLFVMAGHGALIQYDLDTKLASNVAKEKICDDTPIELEVEAKAQWNLGRRKDGSHEIMPPLMLDNWLIKDRNSCMLMDTSRQYDDNDDRGDSWLSQVEIITHAGPHRRLWMGPQFVFKTYNTPSGSNLTHVDAEAVEIGISKANAASAAAAAANTSALSRLERSSPLNMPLSMAQHGHAAVPVLIESGSYSSIEQSPKLMDRFRHEHLNSDYSVAHGDSRLKEDLADAMRETPSALKDTGRLSSDATSSSENVPFYDALAEHYNDDDDQAAATFDGPSTSSSSSATTTTASASNRSSSVAALANALPNIFSYDTIGFETADVYAASLSSKKSPTPGGGGSSIEKVVNPLGTVTTVTACDVKTDMLDEVVSQLAAEECVIHENCDESLFRPVVAIFCDDKAEVALSEEELRRKQELCKPPEVISNKLIVPVIDKAVDDEISKKEEQRKSEASGMRKARERAADVVEVARAGQVAMAERKAKVLEQPKASVKAVEQPKASVKAVEQPKASVKAVEQSKASVKAVEQPKASVKAVEQPKAPEKTQSKASLMQQEPPKASAKVPDQPKLPDTKKPSKKEAAKEEFSEEEEVISFKRMTPQKEDKKKTSNEKLAKEERSSKKSPPPEAKKKEKQKSPEVEIIKVEMLPSLEKSAKDKKEVGSTKKDVKEPASSCGVKLESLNVGDLMSSLIDVDEDITVEEPVRIVETPKVPVALVESQSSVKMSKKIKKKQSKSGSNSESEEIIEVPAKQSSKKTKERTPPVCDDEGVDLADSLLESKGLMSETMYVSMEEKPIETENWEERAEEEVELPKTKKSVKDSKAISCETEITTQSKGPIEEVKKNSDDLNKNVESKNDKSNDVKKYEKVDIIADSKDKVDVKRKKSLEEIKTSEAEKNKAAEKANEKMKDNKSVVESKKSSAECDKESLSTKKDNVKLDNKIKGQEKLIKEATDEQKPVLCEEKKPSEVSKKAPALARKMSDEKLKVENLREVEIEAAKKPSSSAKKAEESKESSEASKKSPSTVKKLLEETKASVEVSKSSPEMAKKKVTEDVKKITDDSKKSTDNSKKSTEDAKKSTEDSKKSLEGSKKSTEDSKKAAEDSKKSPEDSKKSTADSKKSTDELKKTSEDTKKAAKASVEDPKKSAEVAKKSPEESEKSDLKKKTVTESKCSTEEFKLPLEASKKKEESKKSLSKTVEEMKKPLEVAKKEDSKKREGDPKESEKLIEKPSAKSEEVEVKVKTPTKTSPKKETEKEMKIEQSTKDAKTKDTKEDSAAVATAKEATIKDNRDTATATKPPAAVVPETKNDVKVADTGSQPKSPKKTAIKLSHDLMPFGMTASPKPTPPKVEEKSKEQPAPAKVITEQPLKSKTNPQMLQLKDEAASPKKVAPPKEKPSTPSLPPPPVASAWKNLSGAEMISKALDFGEDKPASPSKSGKKVTEKLLPDLPSPLKTPEKKTVASSLKDFPVLKPLECLPPLPTLEPLEVLSSASEPKPPKEESLINFESPLTENPALERKITPPPRGFTEQNLIFALCGSLHYDYEQQQQQVKQQPDSPTEASVTRSSSAMGEQSTAGDYKSLTENDDYMSFDQSSQETNTTNTATTNEKLTSSTNSSACEEIIIVKEKKMTKKQKRKKQQMEIERQKSHSGGASASASGSAAGNTTETDVDEELRPLIGMQDSQTELGDMPAEDQPDSVMLLIGANENARGYARQLAAAATAGATTDSESPMPATTSDDNCFMLPPHLGHAATTTPPNKVKTKKLEHKINLLAAIEAATSSSTSSAEESGIEAGISTTTTNTSQSNGGGCRALDLDAQLVILPTSAQPLITLPGVVGAGAPAASASAYPSIQQQGGTKKKTKRRKR